MTPWGQDSRSGAWFWEVSGKHKRRRLPPKKRAKRVLQNYARIILGSSAAADGIAHNVEEALDIVEKTGYPVLVRPSFVLGGRGLGKMNVAGRCPVT